MVRGSGTIAALPPIDRILALGAAQLGMAYGIANVVGQPSAPSAHEIVAAAWAGGVRTFDTAQAYQASEVVLGRALSVIEDRGQARVITKLAPDLDISSVDAIRDSIVASCEKLGVARLWAVLLHREHLLDLWDGPLGNALRGARADGLLAHLGVSVYGSSRALAALEHPDLDVIQVPANVFDRRMERAGVFARAHAMDKRVFVRSVYLQGLALMPPTSLPAPLSFARPALEALEAHCRKHGLDRGAFAMAYMRLKAPEATLVIGSESRDQVERNVALVKRVTVDVECAAEWDRRWPNDMDELIDPSRWPSVAA
jgi:aryl-alcohol dehydrogenase-like predicted oxidoreductase